MSELFYYKVWNTDLCQYVAQQRPSSLKEIESAGGIVIQTESCRRGDGAFDVPTTARYGRAGSSQTQDFR